MMYFLNLKIYETQASNILGGLAKQFIVFRDSNYKKEMNEIKGLMCDILEQLENQNISVRKEKDTLNSYVQLIKYK